jgi:hypothetical protein
VGHQGGIDAGVTRYAARRRRAVPVGPEGRARLTLIAGFSLTAGIVMATASDYVADGLGDHFRRIAGIAALLAAVVSLVTTALIRWLGTPGVALSALFIMLFSLPATGSPLDSLAAA